MDLTLYLVVALTVVLIPYTTCSSYDKLGGDCNGAFVCRRPVRRPGRPYKRVCVRRNQLCDGVKQCPRGDDERSCRPGIVCPLLNWPANGYVKHDGFQPEDTAIYSCAIGFELTGTATRTCFQTGSWEGSVPTCSPIVPDTECPLLDWPANGYVKHDGFQPEDTAIYSCAIGFELTGTATRTCLQTGSWEGSVPTCSPIVPDTECPLLDWPANGYVKHDGFQPEDTAIYSCAIGFELTGTATRTCLQTGSWEGSVPTCSPIDCGSLPEATRGSFVLTGNSTYGAVALLTCNTNYSVCGDIKPGYTTCNELGQWTEDYAICARKDCYVTGRAIEYCGIQDVQENNESCANWTGHVENDFIDSNFPEGSVTAASNYCRCPDNFSKPWCFASNGNDRYCSVPECA